jgi:hypothetical protein
VPTAAAIVSTTKLVEKANTAPPAAVISEITMSIALRPKRSDMIPVSAAIAALATATIANISPI